MKKYHIKSESIVLQNTIIFVIGEKEVENNTVAIRKLGSKEVKSYSVKETITYIKNEKNKF